MLKEARGRDGLLSALETLATDQALLSLEQGSQIAEVISEIMRKDRAGEQLSPDELDVFYEVLSGAATLNARPGANPRSLGTTLAKLPAFKRIVAPNRTLPNGSPYSQADYDAYVQRKLNAGETPRSPEDYVQRRQQLDQNRADGTRRQEQYRQEMADIYGEENVLTERFLRNANGDVVRDPVTGEGRRLNCVVVNGQCGYAAEVTSPTVDERQQIRKETNIRNAGGIFVENPRTGELIEVENTSEIIRLE